MTNHPAGSRNEVLRFRRDVAGDLSGDDKSWETAWADFVPFLEFPTELRHIVHTTNATESLNARFRRAVRHRGHVPNEQAAVKVLYLVANQRRVNRDNMKGKINGGKHILNTLRTHYCGDRINEAIN